MLIDIPFAFHDSKNDCPFDRCIECEKLFDTDDLYIIEKVVRQYIGYAAKQTIFDFALCLRCAERMKDEISAASSKAINDWITDHLIKQANKYSLDDNVDNMIAKCCVSGRSLSDCEEYQIVGLFRGQKMDISMPAYMISGEAAEQIQQLLSKETKDFFDGFTKKHFSPDPTLFEPTPKLVLF